MSKVDTVVQKEAIKAALADIIDSRSPDKNVIDSGLVSNIVIEGSIVGVILDFKDDKPKNAENLRSEIESVIKGVQDISAANVIMTATRIAPAKASLKPTPNTPPAPPSPKAIPDVKHIIAVASGKGGVGKSTTSVNLALALSKLGYSVGIMDADIFGPSLPTLLGISERPKIKDRVITPIEKFGVKAMSIGMIIDVDQPVVWRGPRVMGATQQLLRDVNWAPLDILIVDMPPGTGDVQITMVQQVPLSGAVIISTPQDLALIDARKGLAMFEKVGTPILGIIENMSTFFCPSCGAESQIFGHGGAKEIANKKDAPFLGAVSLHMDIRETADRGIPIVVNDPKSPLTKAYFIIAGKIAVSLKL